MRKKRGDRGDIESVCPYCECKIMKWNYDGHVKSCARAFGFEEAEDKDIQKVATKDCPDKTGEACTSKERFT